VHPREEDRSPVEEAALGLGHVADPARDREGAAPKDWAKQRAALARMISARAMDSSRLMAEQSARDPLKKAD
jgi:hypothetical protein